MGTHHSKVGPTEQSEQKAGASTEHNGPWGQGDSPRTPQGGQQGANHLRTRGTESSICHTGKTTHEEYLMNLGQGSQVFIIKHFQKFSKRSTARQLVKEEVWPEKLKPNNEWVIRRLNFRINSS